MAHHINYWSGVMVVALLLGFYSHKLWFMLVIGIFGIILL